MNQNYDLPRPVIRPTSLQTTKFRDGMVITADDLDTAMRHPLAVFQTLIRAYFGCGVICGLNLHLKKPHPGAKDSKDSKDEKKPVVICIDRGTALGCDGFPIELCSPATITLTPDPCCDTPPKCVCVAIRRVTSDEAPRDNCGCSTDTDAPGYQCTRVKEHVEIRVFTWDDPPKGLCARPGPKDPKTEGYGEQSAEPAGAGYEVVRDPRETMCECLKTCPDCDCCGPSWVLLGCIDDPMGSNPLVNCDRRKFVKPIECLCPPPPPKPTKDYKPAEPAPQEPAYGDRKKPKRSQA